MQIVGYIIYSLISVFELIMLARAICSWFQYARESRLYAFACAITEPLLRPVRNLMMRFEWARRLPIDLSFLIVYLLLQLVGSLVLYLV